MAWSPYSTDLPTTGTPAKRKVNDAAWDQMMDNHVNWKGNVNGGGFTLSNVNLISGAVGVFGSSTLTFGLITAGDWAELTFALAGAVVGMPVVEAWPATLEDAFRSGSLMRVTTPDVVTVRLFNSSAADVTPAAAQTFGASAGVGVTPGTATLDFPLITDGDWAVLTFSYSGAVVGRPLAEAWPAALEAGLSGSMWISAADTVSVRLDNRSGADLDPASHVFGAAFL